MHKVFVPQNCKANEKVMSEMPATNSLKDQTSYGAADEGFSQ